jgi:hypothetical protein
MYEPVSSLSLVGSLWRSPFEIRLIFNIARRQLIVKSNESNSWFIEIKNILRKYNMLEAWWYLDNAPKKTIWTIAVKMKIHEHWSKPIVESTLLCPVIAGFLCLVVDISNWFLYHLIFPLFLGVLAF